MNEAVATAPEQETEVVGREDMNEAVAPEQVVATKKRSYFMYIHNENPILAFQAIVKRTSPEYIAKLHKLLGTFAELCDGAETKH